MTASFVIYIVSGLNLLYSFLSIRIINIEFGKEFLGEWLVAFTAAQYVLASTTSLSNVIHSRKKIGGALANTSFLVSTCLAICALIALALLAIFFDRSNLALYLSLGYFFFGKSILNVYQSFFLMQGQIIKGKLLELVFLVFSSCHLIFASLLDIGEQQFVHYLLVLGTLHLIVLFVLYFKIGIFFPKFHFARLSTWFHSLGVGALRLFPSTLAATMVWNSDNFLIIANDLQSEIVEYNVYFRVFISAASILTLLSPIIITRLKADSSQITSFLLLWGAMSFAICLIVLLFLELPTNWLLSNNIVVNYHLAGTICAYTVLFTLNSVCASHLLVRQRFSSISKISITEVTVNLAMSLALCSFFGIVGIALGSFLAALVTFLMMLNASYS